MLHHSQLAFSEQAFGPVKRENLSFVKQAGKPVADNGATSQIVPHLPPIEFRFQIGESDPRDKSGRWFSSL
ncbi:hypothetical protein QUB70_29370 [Microcoleus sp. A003_D6]|uniref:hypothetical protein n=1 Tax=Microcoleus sp. A003_D6 TaxID=3055266 RepID=UPI002FD73B05